MLSILTQREREVLMLVRGQGFSFEKVARLLKIKKASTQTLVKRAELKVKNSKTKYDLTSQENAYWISLGRLTSPIIINYGLLQPFSILESPNS